jgi:hypothetical protein
MIPSRDRSLLTGPGFLAWLALVPMSLGIGAIGLFAALFSAVRDQSRGAGSDMVSALVMVTSGLSVLSAAVLFVCTLRRSRWVFVATGLWASASAVCLTSVGISLRRVDTGALLIGLNVLWLLVVRGITVEFSRPTDSTRRPRALASSSRPAV